MTTRKITPLIVFLMFVFVLTGCWDAKVINEMYYVVSIGIDYDFEKEEYICFTQYVDFSSVTQAQGKPSEELPPYIGIGRGKTVNAALNNIYDEAQHRVFWGHVKAIVYSENALRNGLDETFDALNRFPEFRYTPWVYGANGSIMDIFNVTSIFKLSVLHTILHNPTYRYEQRSILPPIRFNEFIRMYDDPSISVVLSNLEMSSEKFFEGKETKEKMRLNGAFILEDNEMKGWVNQEHLMGYRWIQEKTFRTPVILKEDGKQIGVVSLFNPDIKIDFENKNGQVFFDLTINFEANAVDLTTPITESEILKIAEEEIEKEIIDTYLHGVGMKADIYSLGETVYRKDVRLWKQLTKDGHFQLQVENLRNIDVNVNLVNTGKYKLKDRRIYNDDLSRRVFYEE